MGALYAYNSMKDDNDPAEKDENHSARSSQQSIVWERPASLPTLPNRQFFDDDEPPYFVSSASSKKPSRGETNPNAVLKEIEAKIIKMDDGERKKANLIMERFIRDKFVSTMKKMDSLFSVVYRVDHCTQIQNFPCSKKKSYFSILEHPLYWKLF